MSYADLALQRRQLMDAAFRKRYNPLEDTFSELAAIDKETKKAQRDDEEYARKKKESEAESVRAEERLKLEKSRAQEESALRNLSAEKTRIGLINMPGEQALKRYQSEALVKQREAQAAADAARQRVGEEKAARDAEDAAREASLATGKARIAGMRAQGMGYEDIRDSASGDPALDRLDDSDVQSILSQLEGIDAETARKKGESDALIRMRNAQAARASRVAGPKVQGEKEKWDTLYARLKAQAKQKELGEARPGDLTTDAMNKEIDRFNNMVAVDQSTRAIRNVIKKYPQIESYVGPIDDKLEWFFSKIGMSSKEASEIRSMLTKELIAYRHAVTGAAASIPEMRQIASAVPTPSDRLPQIMAKLDASDEMLAPRLRRSYDVIQSKNIFTGTPFEQGAAGMAPPPSAVPGEAVVTPPAEEDEFAQYEVQ
jgi:hypothetical protein